MRGAESRERRRVRQRRRRTSAADRFPIWPKRWQNPNNAKPAISERNSKVNCQSSPSSEARQCVQCSAELTTAVGHLLRASQQCLMQPFVCRSSASIVSFPDIVYLIRAPQRHPQAQIRRRTIEMWTVEGCRQARSKGLPWRPENEPVAMESEKESVPSFESKTWNKFSFSPSSDVRQSVQCC